MYVPGGGIQKRSVFVARRLVRGYTPRDRMDAHDIEAKRLREDVEWALRRCAAGADGDLDGPADRGAGVGLARRGGGIVDPGDVLPLLHRLTRTAATGSEECIYAHRQLAELLVERDPWRAGLHARKVLTWVADDDRAWAVLGLCQTLLGHYRYAATAYSRALSAAPTNPWYAHNLGHLLDVALGRAAEAVPWLRTAYEGTSGNREIAASFAHALARAGKLPEAKRVLSGAMAHSVSREQAALWEWLEQGAPADKDAAQARPEHDPRASGHFVTSAASAEAAGDCNRRAACANGHANGQERHAGYETCETCEEGASIAADLDTALVRGLEKLPLDARQRARARALACDPVSQKLARGRGDSQPTNPHSLAAAIAYAVVYIDHVPLTQAEVAASFRVSAASLRGRFSVLRTQLHLVASDARQRPRRH